MRNWCRNCNCCRDYLVIDRLRNSILDLSSWNLLLVEQEGGKAMYGYGAACCRPVCAPVAPVGVGVGVGIIAIAILILIALGLIF